VTELDAKVEEEYLEIIKERYLVSGDKERSMRTRRLSPTLVLLGALLLPSSVGSLWAPPEEILA